jgi:hypothetical protein
LTSESTHRAVSRGIAVATAITIAFLAGRAGKALVHPDLAAQLLTSQERACVIRKDVCELASILLANGARTFEVGPGLDAEVSQRLTELAYPVRAMRGAGVIVNLCVNVGAVDRLWARVPNVKSGSDSGSDVCIFDRR